MNTEHITGWKRAAEYTGKSIASLRRLVARGDLLAEKDAQGRHVFNPDDLDGVRMAPVENAGATSRPEPSHEVFAVVPSTRPTLAPGSDRLDDLEQAVYLDLARGISPGDVVLRHGVDPRYVAQRAAAWDRLHKTGGNPLALEVNALRDEVDSVKEWLVQLQQQINRLGQEQQALLLLIKTTDAMVKALATSLNR